MYWLIAGVIGGVGACYMASRASRVKPRTGLKWHNWVCYGLWYVALILAVSFVLVNAVHSETRAALVGSVVILLPVVMVGLLLLRPFYRIGFSAGRKAAAQ